MRKIKGYFKGVAIEARRVRWPHKKELLVAVLTVCIISIIAALVIFFEDWIAAQIIAAFENANPNPTSSSSSPASASN